MLGFFCSSRLLSNATEKIGMKSNKLYSIVESANLPNFYSFVCNWKFYANFATKCLGEIW